MAELGRVPKQLEYYKGRPGVWVIYDYEHAAVAESIHLSALDAIEALRIMGATKIAFWPIGWQLAKAVREWEKRTPEEEVTNEGTDRDLQQGGRSDAGR